MPEDELFGVSDIEINEDSDQDQYPKDQVPHSNDEIDSQSEILTKKKRVHKDYGRHQCGVCHKVFPWRQSLNLHKREHFGKWKFKMIPAISVVSDDVEKRLPYQCEICSKRFGHPTAFKNHKIIHLRMCLAVSIYYLYFFYLFLNIFIYIFQRLTIQSRRR